MVSISSASTIEVVQRIHPQRYHWPAQILNFWLLVMFVGSCLNLGVFANFMEQQRQLRLPTPWYFVYWVTTAALSLALLLAMLWLIMQNLLLPGVVMTGTFVLFVLWLAGLIIAGIQLWGPHGVAKNCSEYVAGQVFRGASIDTLAWLEQNSICQSWDAAWAFELIGVIFLLWMMLIAWNVYRD